MSTTFEDSDYTEKQLDKIEAALQGEVEMDRIRAAVERLVVAVGAAWRADLPHDEIKRCIMQAAWDFGGQTFGSALLFEAFRDR